MKHAIRIAIGFIGLSSIYAAHGQVLLSDTFPGTVLDPSNWVASTPVAGASVAVNNGLVLTNGGAVLTATAFPTSEQIDMSFEFTGTSYDSFKLVTRTNGVVTNNSGEFDSGIVVSFRMQSDPGDPAGTSNNVDLYDTNTPISQTQLGLTTFEMTQGQVYNVRLDETPTEVSLYINDFSTPLLAAATTSSYGGLIGLNNREGAAAGSGISEGSQVTIDSFSVTAIPESPSYAALLGLAAIGFAVAQRRCPRARGI